MASKKIMSGWNIAVRSGEYNLYRITDKRLVNLLFIKYKESFTDKVVNNFVDICDELK
jgi:hypothetical protein